MKIPNMPHERVIVRGYHCRNCGKKFSTLMDYINAHEGCRAPALSETIKNEEDAHEMNEYYTIFLQAPKRAYEQKRWSAFCRWIEVYWAKFAQETGYKFADDMPEIVHDKFAAWLTTQFPAK